MTSNLTPASPAPTAGRPVRHSPAAWLGLWFALAAAPAVAADPAALLRAAIAAGCATPAPDAAQLAAALPGGEVLADEPLAARGGASGWQRRIALTGGAELRIARLARGERLLRLSAEYWAPEEGGGVRPELAAIADSSCAIRTGRRLVYESSAPQPVAIEHLDAALSPTGAHEPLDPPVPPGADPGGVPVAIVDAGVNYLLPGLSARLARDGDGRLLGHDYWDLDPRPFDAHPAGSPFFPQRHGTRTATLLAREAPAARIVPYRYPRPEMSRMSELVRDAAAKGVVVVNLSMGSNRREDWEAFAAAARAHPHMLFVLSAGNNQRDIDAQPVYPAALRLGNAITVTSAEHTGDLAPGSNWGRESVDLMVPAEQLTVTDFDGREVAASGSSYAAIRVTALAARFLGHHPDWRAPQLKAAILARALPDARGSVGRGFIPRPDKAETYAPAAADARSASVVAREVIAAAELYGGGTPAAATHLLRPTFAWFANTAWNRDALLRHARRTAEILAQCGIHIPQIDLRVLDGPETYRYFREASATELVRELDLPRPTVYFVRDTLQPEPFEAEAIGEGNSATRPLLRDTIWVIEEIRDAGVALAHELVHILMNSGEHVDLPRNLMRADTAPGNTELTDAQCVATIRAGSGMGLLAPARGQLQ